MIALSDGILVLEVYEVGAYVASLAHGGADVMLRGDPSRPTRGGMAFLAPFANRVRGGTYYFDGVRYELPRNEEGNAIHGLVLGTAFDVTDLGDNYVRLETSLEHPGYPSKLAIAVEYIVRGSLKARAEVRNVGSRRAPVVVGWHPYFVVEGGWALEGENVKRCLAIGKIPTGDLVEHVFVPNGSYDDCFLVPSGRLVLTSAHGRVEISSDNMKYFQVYTGVPGAVAVEPMSGAPDAFNNGMGLTVLEPGGSAEFEFEVRYSGPSHP